MKDPRESPGKPESMGSSQENRQHTVVSEHVGTHELFLHGSDPKALISLQEDQVLVPRLATG